MSSFNFDLSRKLDSNTEKNNIRDALTPENEINIKSKLKNGGEILLTDPDRERTIEIPNTFLLSKNVPKIKFTNFVNKNDVQESTRKTLKAIIDDISYICRNNEQIDFSRTNTSNLRSVLKEYGTNETLSADNTSIYKIDGIPYYESQRKENPFRIYMKIDEFDDSHTKYKLIFCDIYHLCLITGHHGLSPTKTRERTYLEHCYVCKNHLKELIDVN